MRITPIKIATTTALVGVFCATLHPAGAADISWDGGGGNPNWGTAANWNTDSLPTAADNVYINVGTSLNAGRRLTIDTTVVPVIQSLTVGLNHLVLRTSSGADRSLTIGESDTSSPSFITMNGNAHNTEPSFTSSGTTNRLLVRFGHEITLTGNGNGEYRFAAAMLTNTSNSTGTDTIFFAGAGNWGFVTTDGGQNSALQKSSANATLDVELKSGSGGFTGVLRYATTNAMNVDNLRVNSGKFYLENSTLTTIGNSQSTGLTVGAGGTFSGAGIVNGSATVNGILDVGTNDNSGRVLSFNNGLTLQSGARVKIGIESLTAYDSITLPGEVLILDGTLEVILTGSYSSGDSWNLFGDFDSASGSFSAVSVNSLGLTLNGNIWTGIYNGQEIQFDQSTGILSVGQTIPEPATMGLFLGGAIAALAVARRRSRR